MTSRADRDCGRAGLRPATGEKRDGDHKRLNDCNKALVIAVSPLSRRAYARPAAVSANFAHPSALCVVFLADVDTEVRSIIAAMKPSDCILFSGGAPGAESYFGACAERHGVEEVNFTFDGHKIDRHRGVRVLNHEELLAGDVSLQYVSRLMHRRYTEGPTLRKVLQTLWYQVNNGQEIYVIGSILDDGTVRGGTGWGAEFAKLCNKPLYVFDQDRNGWSRWTGDEWEQLTEQAEPVITHPHFSGTGTRTLRDNGAKAIEALFKRSFT